jgi:hypothetical protein
MIQESLLALCYGVDVAKRTENAIVKSAIRVFLAAYSEGGTLLADAPR